MSWEHFQQLKAGCSVFVGPWNLKLSLQLRGSYTRSSRGFAQVSSRACFVCFWHVLACSVAIAGPFFRPRVHVKVSQEPGSCCWQLE